MKIVGVTVALILITVFGGLLLVAGLFAVTEQESEQEIAAAAAQGSISSRNVPNGWAEYVDTAGGLCPEFPAHIIAAQLDAESGWDPDAVSPAGAVGLAQFMPGTWTQHGTDGDADGVADPRNPADAILSAGVYDCHLIDVLREAGLKNPSTELGLAAYNAGPGAVITHNGVPPFPETQGYVPKIIALGAEYNGGGAGTPVLAGYDPSPTNCPSSRGVTEAGLKPGALRGIRCVSTAFSFASLTSGWRPRGSVSVSDHPFGNAIDVSPGPWQSEQGNTQGWFLAHWFQVNADRLGVKYIIWDNWTWNPAKKSGAWIPYVHATGRTDPSARHEDHVHVSFTGPVGNDTAPLLNHSPATGTSRVPFRPPASVLTN
ncbi:MAG: lytic transglycosylase domain-containing protein [Ornithinimicrobium sp.]